jgi:cobyrinic acid a,c-diamide synthase
MPVASLMIAAPQGRSGKTTVSMGLCAALRRRGLKVKPFKKGPDYIDPSWLTAAAGHACGNLDPFMFDETTLQQAFMLGCQDMDIAVIEASMGLYDSPGEDGSGSSAWLARLLKVPVILIVNSARMARSAAAMVSGYMSFEPGTNITGVILNNVAGRRHRDKLVKAIEQHCGIPVLGCIPSDKGLALKERHIGIVPFIEQDGSAGVIENACAVIENNVDLDRVSGIARGADRLPRRCAPRNDEVNTVCDSDTTVIAVSRSCEPKSWKATTEQSSSDHAVAGSSPSYVIARSPQATRQSDYQQVKIGVLYDRAFSFYYPDNLEALQKAGAGLVFINSFTDSLPDIDGLYIGGGFPELYAAELEANACLRQDVAAMAREGLPVYAECAGLMYLCRAILKDNRRYEMAGVFAADAEITGKPQGHGYMEVEVSEGNPFFRPGAMIKGHEFHYSRLTAYAALNATFNVRRGHGINGSADGMVHKNTLAAYLHLHALSVPGWASDFVKISLSHKISPIKIAV